LNETEVRKIGQSDCKKWARVYAKTASPTRYNNTAAVLRHVLNVAIEAGVIYSNPALVVKRAAIRSKQNSLPITKKFNAMIAEMRAGPQSRLDKLCRLGGGLSIHRLSNRRSTTNRVARRGFWRWRDRPARRCRYRHEELGIAPCPANSWRSRAVSTNAERTFPRVVGCESIPCRRMPEVSQSSVQKSWHRSHHPSRLATPVRDALYRKRRWCSYRFTLAWTQRRWRAGNENLRPPAARA